MILVGINGYGTIGKRVADAVSMQPDMNVAGVVKTRPTHEAKHAIKSNYGLYANNRENMQKFIEADMAVLGTLEDLIDKSDIIVDCTPGKIGAANKPLYVSKGIKAIFQGGEKPDIAEVSFNSQGNYKECIGKDYARVVSCNTTGLCRTLGAIEQAFGGIRKTRITLIRRGPDPGNSSKGPVNAIVPNPVTVPSHHGPDVNTIFPDMDIMTSAVVVPTTLMHLHTMIVELKNPATTGDIIKLFKNTPRIILVRASEGIASTAEIMEHARDIGRKRGDLNEIAVWEESINVVGNELFYIQAIHQESDVVPENIDCIRAMCGLTQNASESIAMTDKALGLTMN
ncbi:MAG: type II glyceraldehyde-3-phosphate dehydrogenase [Candidatus Nanohalarchaeota archaeon]|nr:MAG: type II glyceraldehyde-3-phosphate dehydrogenase [Candidatus Nanohaloarchaeota archaeon]